MQKKIVNYLKIKIHSSILTTPHLIYYTQNHIPIATNLLYGELAVTEFFLSTPEFVLDLNLGDLQLLRSRYQCFDVTLDLGDVDPGHCVILLQLVRGTSTEL